MCLDTKRSRRVVEHDGFALRDDPVDLGVAQQRLDRRRVDGRSLDGVPTATLRQCVVVDHHAQVRAVPLAALSSWWSR